MQRKKVVIISCLFSLLLNKCRIIDQRLGWHVVYWRFCLGPDENKNKGGVKIINQIGVILITCIEELLVSMNARAMHT